MTGQAHSDLWWTYRWDFHDTRCQVPPKVTTANNSHKVLHVRRILAYILNSNRNHEMSMIHQYLFYPSIKYSNGDQWWYNTDPVKMKVKTAAGCWGQIDDATQKHHYTVHGWAFCTVHSNWLYLYEVSIHSAHCAPVQFPICALI